MKRTIMIVTDDLDGAYDAIERTFGLDGVAYSIDLHEGNYIKLCDALARYIEAGVIVTRNGNRKPAVPLQLPKQRQSSGDSTYRPRGTGGYDSAVPARQAQRERAVSRSEVRNWWRRQDGTELPPYNNHGRVPNVVMTAWYERDGGAGHSQRDTA